MLRPLIFFCSCILITFFPSVIGNKLSHYINAITEPYSNLYKGLNQEFVQQIFSIFPHKGHSKSTTNEVIESMQKLVFEEKYQVTRETSSPSFDGIFNEKILSQKDGKGRILQSPLCSNVGHIVNSNYTLYFCNDRLITKEEFEESGGISNPNCRITKGNADICYCPMDFYGWICEVPVPLRADLRPVNALGDCTGEDSFEYIYSYGGNPPCVTAEVGDTFNLEYQVSLKFDDRTWEYEGIKIPRMIYWDPVTPPSPFVYEIVGPDVKLTKTPVDMTLDIQFIDFRYMTLSRNFSVVLDANQLSSTKNAIVTLQIDEALKESTTSGRYYFEANVHYQSSVITDKGDIGVLEVAGYKEPLPIKKKSRKTLIIIFAVLGVLLALTLYYFLIVKPRKIEKKRRMQMHVEAINDEVY